MDIINLKYSDFKNILAKKRMRMQYIEDDNFYYLFAYDSVIKYTCNLLKNASNSLGLSDEERNTAQEDLIDFETNYKSKANRPLNISSIELDYYVEGKTLSISAEDTTGEIIFSFPEEVEVSGIYVHPIAAQSGDMIKMEKWVVANVLGPTDVKTGDFGVMYPRGGDGSTATYFKGYGTGLLPPYAYIKVTYTKASNTGSRDFCCELEVLK